MMLAFRFGTWPLLIGVLAAAIPFVLHLLASVRARQAYFPTLRFLRLSMEKTARRRRIQHWMLLLLRALLLAVLALGVAEPISQAAGQWLKGSRSAVVVVLDDSYSMAVRHGEGTRFDAAKTEVAALLSGKDKPALAAVVTTAGEPTEEKLTDRLDQLRDRVAKTTVSYSPPSTVQRLEKALELLKGRDDVPQRAVYLFSDLQRADFEELIAARSLAEAKDVHLLVVDTGGGEVTNVGIEELEITGRRVVNSVLTFAVTLVNSSPAKQKARVALRVAGSAVGQPIVKDLAAAGREGAIATVRFRHRFARPGPVTGQVYLDADDDLAADNVRRFSLNIGGQVRVLVVRGQPDPIRELDPVFWVRLALDPYAGEDVPWPISIQIAEAGAWEAEDLSSSDAAVFCEAPSFTKDQAGAIAEFTAAGGTAVFFLGPQTDPANYNEVFNDSAVPEIKSAGGLLPGRIQPAVGQVGPEAPATESVYADVAHPYFADLYKDLADYPAALVQRYFPLSRSPRPGRVLMRLADGAPMLVEKSVASGRVVLCTTTSSIRWSDFPARATFLPFLVRATMLARTDHGRDRTYPAGGQVAIRLPARADDAKAPTVSVLSPASETTGAVAQPPVTHVPGEGYVATFSETAQPGFYEWKAARGGLETDGGRFAVNPYGRECRLESIPSDALVGALERQGFERAYVGASAAEAAAAADPSANEESFWDELVVLAIVLLCAEAVLANRGRRGEAYLNSNFRFPVSHLPEPRAGQIGNGKLEMGK